MDLNKMDVDTSEPNSDRDNSGSTSDLDDESDVLSELDESSFDISESESEDRFRGLEGTRRKPIWSFLEHKGPLFAPPYSHLPDNVHFYYENEEMKLSLKSEEVAGFYARLKNHKFTAVKVFNDNFFKDWREVMTSEERKKIENLEKCNFKEMTKYFEEQEKENVPNESEFGECTVIYYSNRTEIKVQQVSGFRIEPGLFYKCRDTNPKMGKLKTRIMPEDVVINCSRDSNIPEAPPGHNWKGVVHDNTVSWLAYWIGNVDQNRKYMRFHRSADCNMVKDEKKFEKARELKMNIARIKDTYYTDLNAEDLQLQQCATAVYLIDHFWFRIGNEKNSKEEVDTVGCCTLRIEHVKLFEEDHSIEFDFLGKGSVRYYKKNKLENITVFENLKNYVRNNSKGKDSKLFDKLDSKKLNKYLNEMMEMLTVKVFRTYHASIMMQQYLNEHTQEGATEQDKMIVFEEANRKVAVMLNHIRKEQTSLMTSILYYIDPRIIYAWCLKHNVSINKIYTAKGLRKIFDWAFKKNDQESRNFVF